MFVSAKRFFMTFEASAIVLLRHLKVIRITFSKVNLKFLNGKAPRKATSQNEYAIISMWFSK